MPQCWIVESPVHMNKLALQQVLMVGETSIRGLHQGRRLGLPLPGRHQTEHRRCTRWRTSFIVDGIDPTLLVTQLANEPTCPPFASPFTEVERTIPPHSTTQSIYIWNNSLEV